MQGPFAHTKGADCPENWHQGREETVSFHVIIITSHVAYRHGPHFRSDSPARRGGSK